MTWDKFIRDGFMKESEVDHAKKHLQKYGPEIIPKDGNLEVCFYVENKMRMFTVVCRCGNTRMLLHPNGIRCHVCGAFHTHDSFLLAKEKARKLARTAAGEAGIKQIPQPLINKQQSYGKENIVKDPRRQTK